MNLEQKEQIIRNALAEVGVQSASQVVKLIKRDDAVEVYINELYFDTYDFNEGRFLEHSSELASGDFFIEENDEQIMYAVIYNENLLDDCNYIGAQLGFPASVDEVEIAFNQAGIAGTEDCKIKYLRWKDYIFDSDEIAEASVEELNFFCRRVCEMDWETRLIFEGCLLTNQKYQSINDLINLTYSLENCRILHDVANDTQLGRYYADNGLVEELHEIPETVAAFIDYEKIGKAMRESENGVFLEGCYISNENDELMEVYDGKNLPENHDFDNIFTVYTSFGDNMQKKSLSLPADENQMSAFLKEVKSIIVAYNSKVIKTKTNMGGE